MGLLPRPPSWNPPSFVIQQVAINYLGAETAAVNKTNKVSVLMGTLGE